MTKSRHHDFYYYHIAIGGLKHGNDPTLFPSVGWLAIFALWLGRPRITTTTMAGSIPFSALIILSQYIDYSGSGEGEEDFVETFMTCYDTGETSKYATTQV